MFNQKKTVIYLDRETIRVGQVVGDQVKNEQLLAESWKEEDFEPIFKEIKSTFGRSAYVILGDDLSYVLYEQISLKKDELLVDALKQLVIERIPEDISGLNWHHRILNKTEDKTTIQVSAFVTERYEKIMAAFKEVDIKVNRVEPLSLALASQIKFKKESILLIYQGYRNLAVVVNQSAVIGSESLNTSEPKKEIGSLMIFVRERYDMEVKDLKQRDLHPMVGIVKMQDKNEVIEKKAKPRIRENNDDKERKSLSKNVKMLALIPALGILLLALLSFRGWLPESFNVLQPSEKNQEEMPVVIEETEVLIEEEVYPSPSSESVDLAQYFVQILNGSGISGEAGVVEDILAAEGFENFETGNADNYDYEETEIQLKESIPDQIFDDLERALNSDYEIVLSQEVLTSDADYDVIVVVGKNKETE